MADKMAEALDWFAGKMQEFVSREVTYTGVRDGQTITATLTVSLDSSQLTQINSIGIEPGITSQMLMDPAEFDRDYVVVQQDMRDEGLWPPIAGDFVLDENDVDGSTYKFVVMGIPGQGHWRPLAGGYSKMARIHTKFKQEVVSFWSDAFTDTNGTALTSHTADSGGSYSGGSGTISISSNKIVAGAASVYTFFNHGEDDGSETRIAVSFNDIAAADLDGKYAQLGVGIRCTTSGAGLRNGYYCLLKVSYSGATQTAVLRIVEVASAVETERATVTLSSALGLNTAYELVVYDDVANGIITVGLTDETGEVPLGSVDYTTETYSGNTGAAVRFAHHATLASFATPYMDDLTVTQ